MQCSAVANRGLTTLPLHCNSKTLASSSWHHWSAEVLQGQGLSCSGFRVRVTGLKLGALKIPWIVTSQLVLQGCAGHDTI